MIKIFKGELVLGFNGNTGQEFFYKNLFKCKYFQIAKTWNRNKEKMYQFKHICIIFVNYDN